MRPQAALRRVEESDSLSGVEHGVLLLAPEVEHLRRASVQKGVAGGEAGLGLGLGSGLGLAAEESEAEDGTEREVDGGKRS